MPGEDDLGLGLISTFIREAVGDGLGVTAARSAFREQGLGRISNETFGQLYGEARASAARMDAFATLDYRVVPSGEQYDVIRAGGPTRYLTNVAVPVRETGSRDVITRFDTYMTAQPHTPQQAIDYALSHVGDRSESGTDFGVGSPIAAWIESIGQTTGPA